MWTGKINVSKYVYILGLISVIELIFCGSGQIAKFGPVTLRMILYSICLFSSVILCIRYRYHFSVTDINVLLYFLFLFLFNIGIGLINGAECAYMIEDIKPLSFFFILPFLLIFIRSHIIIIVFDKFFRYLPLLMAVIYIIFLIAIKALGIITFSEVYEDASTETDFIFRGNGGELFYKGFIFLPIGLLFWLRKRKLIPVLVISIAILFTLTRGFYIITVIGVFLYYYITSHDSRLRLFLILFAVSSAIILIPFLQMKERSDSDYIRVITTSQVIDTINPISLFIGHGYGVGVPIRKTHMENSFLEIFHKSGIIGFVFWCYILFCIFRNYRFSKNNENSLLYFIGTIMIYVQSLFNPFISNPIGMGFVLISYCVTKYYFKSEQHSNLLRHFQPKYSRD